MIDSVKKGMIFTVWVLSKPIGECDRKSLGIENQEYGIIKPDAGASIFPGNVCCESGVGVTPWPQRIAENAKNDYEGDHVVTLPAFDRSLILMPGRLPKAFP